VNACFVTADGVHVIEHAGRLEVHPGEIVLIRSDHPGRRPLAAVRPSDRMSVAIGARAPGLPWTPRPPGPADQRTSGRTGPGQAGLALAPLTAPLR
jgi:hypothetical protein